MYLNNRNSTRVTARRNSGFTLMEVLLVLVILVVLASLAVQTYRGVQDRALKDAAKTKVGLIAGQVDTYQLHMLSWPGSLQDLVNKPSDARAADRWSGPYIKDTGGLNDPWGNEIRYVAPGKHNSDSYDIWSTGPDAQDGTGDDIGNWSNT